MNLFILIGFHLLAVIKSLNVGQIGCSVSRQIHSCSRSRDLFSTVTTPISPFDDEQANSVKGLGQFTTRRRHLLQSFCAVFISSLSLSRSSIAADDEPPPQERSRTILSGTVTLAPDVDDLPKKLSDRNTSALYITCRPDKPDNVPQGILNGSRGKAPPVMAARFENPNFPFPFDLVSPTHLTPEGASASQAAANIAAADATSFWWSSDDLIVSARWDSDGVAATRDPEDLVGRGLWKYKVGSVSSENDGVEIMLTGRGAFGKLVTGSSKK
jgi:hypothetical protein